ncbi:MAG: SPASM domain-containing protein, partial [Deltaproteobacteria bacterium]|nr:SPASM domain-containing protein [Deltaproteobacteria bacterium]
VAEARTRHFNVKLLSSGTMWTARHWDRIAELGVSCVRFSLYATQACVHDQVTLTPGSHAKTMASAMALLDRGVQVELACPVMKANAHEVGEVIALGEKLGVAVGMDPNITLTDTSGNLPKKTVATFEQLVAVYRDPRVKARLMTVDACEPTGDARPCGVGEVSTFIQSSGDVLPCSNWPQSAGNILEQSYLDIFRGSPVFKYCRSLRRRDLTTCSGCGDKAVCHPCAAMNLRETGSVGKPSSTVCNSAAASAVALFGETRQMHRRGRLPIVAVIVA